MTVAFYPKCVSNFFQILPPISVVNGNFCFLQVNMIKDDGTVLHFNNPKGKCFMLLYRP